MKKGKGKEEVEERKGTHREKEIKMGEKETKRERNKEREKEREKGRKKEIKEERKK